MGCENFALEKFVYIITFRVLPFFVSFSFTVLVSFSLIFYVFCLMIIRMTSFSIDETSNQSCSSPVLGKRKPVKPQSSVWEHFIKVEGCDPKYPRVACKHCGASYACDFKEMVPLI